MQAVSQREDAWKALEEQTFDLLIVGGGVIGAGAARDAALRGLRVAVVEADDIASGTSSRSSKLIHGGLRYLEQGDISLVFESVSERRIMMHVAPHLVRPLGFLFPVYANGPVRLTTLKLGLIVYEGLALFRSPKMHRNLSIPEIHEEFPLLRQDGLHGGPLYWDCATDDARLTLETMLDAQNAGAVVLTHAKVKGLFHGADGRVNGVEVTDNLGSSRSIQVRAAVVINATGPWSDRIRSHGEQKSHQLRLTKGVHIVVPADRLPLPHTVVAFHPKDQRVLFFIPWGDRVYIGTTDTDYEGDPAEVHATREDVDYLFTAFELYFPTVKMQRGEITATWAGLRPLIRAEGVPPSQVSREHVITTDADGLVSIAGGKLTTHRRMGAEVVEEAIRVMEKAGHSHPPLKVVNTAQLPLPGAVGWGEEDEGAAMIQKVIDTAHGLLPESTCRYLADRYGSRAVDLIQMALQDQERLAPLVPGRPEILAQVDWAVQQELAATVTDFMERRTQLYFRDVDQGLGALEVVKNRMAALLGWTAVEAEGHAQHYRNEVARSRRWKA